MISTIVSKIANKNKLYYFNYYYTKDELDNINYCIQKLTNKELYAKEILLNDYPSQEQIIWNNHEQNIIYEKFISYNNWQ